MNNNAVVPYNDEPENLRELLRGVVGKPRKYLVLRMAGVEKVSALDMLLSDKWGLVAWSRTEPFQTVNKRIKYWEAEFKPEAIKMLRRSNQLLATLFEQNVINILVEELASGTYHLLKTNIAKEVYSKLINDLDTIPAVQHNSWEQNIGKIIQQGGAPGDNRQTEGTENKEHHESLDEVASFQEGIQDVKEDTSSGVFTTQEEAVQKELEDER